jgi:hypothetical protein
MPNVKTISKLDAACSQLETAIRLFSQEGDEVSIHTLACAAYEMIHTISKKRGRKKPLMFDSNLVDKRNRDKFTVHLKKAAGFFKHADHDTDGTIQFDPTISEMFIMFALLGLGSMEIPVSPYGHRFLMWFEIFHPNTLTAQGKEKLHESFTVEQLAEIRSLSRSDFFETVPPSHNPRAFIKI